MAMRITERDQEVARKVVSDSIRSHPDQFQGVGVGAFPGLASAVACGITSERHRLLEIIANVLDMQVHELHELVRASEAKLSNQTEDELWKRSKRPDTNR